MQNTAIRSDDYLLFDVNGDGSFLAGCIVDFRGHNYIVAKSLSAVTYYIDRKEEGTYWKRKHDKELGLGSFVFLFIESSVREKQGVVIGMDQDTLVVGIVSSSNKYVINDISKLFKVSEIEMSDPKELCRGEIWLAHSEKSIKKNSATAKMSIQGGYRPYVICSSNMASNSEAIQCSPVSSASRREYGFLQNIELQRPSSIHYEQLTLLPRINFSKKIGKLTPAQLVEMDKCLSVPLDLIYSSILHIKKIKALYTINTAQGLAYTCEMLLETCARTFSFTHEELVTQGGYIGSPDICQVESFLNHLDGLKFSHSKVKGEMQ